MSILPARNLDDPDNWVGIFEDELTRVIGIGDEEDDQFDAMAWAVLSLQRMGMGMGEASEVEGAFVCGTPPYIGVNMPPHYEMCHHGQW